jgi:hypothetical protein
VTVTVSRGNSYQVRVRAADLAGNTSPFVVSQPIVPS